LPGFTTRPGTLGIFGVVASTGWQATATYAIGR
jgi:hypothetical protein